MADRCRSKFGPADLEFGLVMGRMNAYAAAQTVRCFAGLPQNFRRTGIWAGRAQAHPNAVICASVELPVQIYVSAQPGGNRTLFRTVVLQFSVLNVADVTVPRRICRAEIGSVPEAFDDFHQNLIMIEVFFENSRRALLHHLQHVPLDHGGEFFEAEVGCAYRDQRHHVVIKGAAWKKIPVLTEAADVGGGSGVHMGIDESRREQSALRIDIDVSVASVIVTHLLDAIPPNHHCLVLQDAMAMAFGEYHVTGTNCGDQTFLRYALLQD